MEFVLTHNGEAFPVDTDLITAADLVDLRNDLAVTWHALAANVDTGQVELPEVVGLMVLSLRQRGIPADVRWLLRQVTMASVVQLDTNETADPTPEELEAAMAVVAAARG